MYIGCMMINRFFFFNIQETYFADEIVKVLLGYLPVKDESKSVNSPLLPAVSQTFYNVVNTVHRDSENRVSSYSVP